MIEFKLEERKIDWRKKKKEKNGKGKILKFKKARNLQILNFMYVIEIVSIYSRLPISYSYTGWRHYLTIYW